MLRAAFWILRQFAVALHTFNRWGGFSPGGALGSARFASRWEQQGWQIAVFARMGAGKGVGIVIPNLLDNGGSIVCTDIKGENRAMTARRRAKVGKVLHWRHLRW